MSMHATIFTWDEVLPCFWLMAPVGGGIAGLGLPVSSVVVRGMHTRKDGTRILRIPSWINDCRPCRRHETMTKLRLQALAQSMAELFHGGW